MRSCSDSLGPEPLLRELAGLYSVAESGLMVVSEQDVMSMAQDEARELILGNGL